ncbi:hypothetical protein O3P69_003459 [Scylla paramamosain]|uniref:28S ribosomal protein S27, mitochondrial n=1 Tax=Scylla paramamosain TaxID=85552 RepID=A0AAW0UIM0_SCYPA
MAGRALRPVVLHRLLFCRNAQLQKSRHFLSANYRCDETWNKRLENPLVSSINLGDFYYDLNQKYRHEGKVSAIDVDLFMNRIDDPNAEGVAEEVEELVRHLRRSPETANTLESTHYAVVRALLDGGHTSVLMQLLTQPMMYGLFPDHLTCNLLMHTFLQRKEYTAAARVASYLMLQEDFGPHLTQALALASCYYYITSEDNQPWEDYTPKVEEPKEEVKIRVKFLRNPYYDDHFDLKEPDHLVGKTLAWASPLVGGLVGRSCEVLGWALYGKWDELEAALDRLRTGKEHIAASVKENYHRWEKQREEEYQKQIEEYRKKQLMAKIEHKKQDLAAREEVIFFFDNKNKLSLLLSDAKKKYYHKKSPAYPKKKKPRVIDEAYIPPEV